jgi:dienelactone hydrolase
MRSLGKRFDVARYTGATHSFLRYQVEGLNAPATQEAWPRATAFLEQQLQPAARSR